MSQVTEQNSNQPSPKSRKDFEAIIIAKAWKDEAFKQELLSNPKAVIEREFNVQFPEGIQVNVKSEDANNLYLVLPIRPDLSDAELTEEQLEAVAGGTWGAVLSVLGVATAFVHFN